MTVDPTVRRGLLQIVALAALLALGARFVAPYWVGLLTEALIWAMFALSLDLLLGHAGLPSLGHAAFYGMGAYAAALWFLKAGGSFFGCMAVGMSFASIDSSTAFIR